MSPAASWRYLLVAVAGEAQRTAANWTREEYPGFLVRRALRSGARIPRSLRRYL